MQHHRYLSSPSASQQYPVDTVDNTWIWINSHHAKLKVSQHPDHAELLQSTVAFQCLTYLEIHNAQVPCQL